MPRSSFLRTGVRVLEAKSFAWLRTFGGIGFVVLICMMMVVVADALGRKFLRHPVFGAYESVQFLLSLLFFSSIIYAGIKKTHLVINMVTSHFQPRIRLRLVTVNYFVCTVLCWVLAWQLVNHGLLQKASNVTGLEFTYVPIYPFVWWAAFCLVVLGLVFLVQTIGFLAQAAGKH